MMVLLNGHSLQARARFQPESMPLNLEERNSTASITVGPDAPEIRINDWLMDETEPGAGIVWRVKMVNEVKETQTRTIALEHVVQYLKDQLMFGEVTPATITGNGKADRCTAREAAVYVMNRQSLWRLGTLEGNRTAPYNFNGDNLFSAMETITGSMEDMQWEYDLTSMPFTLNLVKQPTGIRSEMRMRRNITSMRVQTDRSRMYTRIYPIGKNNLHISGDYLSRNEQTWGVVCKVETDQSQDTEEKLRDWAQERLSRHCEPLVTVTVTGLELSEATGEPLDHIVLGRRCRIPLPDYGTTITERVTKLSWADKIKEPEKVTVTLANNAEDVASIVNSQSASSGKGGRASAKQKEEDHAWFVDTTTHVGMIAEAVAGPGSAEDWSRVASVIVDGEGIHQRVTRTEGEVVAMWSSIEVLDNKIEMEVANAKSDTFAKIEMTASSIRSEVNSSKSTIFSTIMQTATNIYTQVGNAKSDTYSKIEQTASSIRSEVNSSKSTIFSTIMQTATNIYTQVGNAKSDTYSKIEQTASSIRSEVNSSKSSLWSSIMQTSTEISLKVSKDGVISSINQSAEQISINASKINLNGYVKATDITADLIKSKIADIATMTVQNISSERGGISVYTVKTTSLEVGGVTCYVPNAVYDLQITLSGNTYTLKRKRFNDEGWTDVGTFSRATSLSGAWSSGTLTVTASPQSEEFKRTLSEGSRQNADGTAYTTGTEWYVPINALYGNSGQYSESTGWRIHVDASTYVPPHDITAFDTTAPSGASYNNLTNNADGYVISGNNAYIVTKSTWKCDGVDKEALSYLASAPTKLYAKGKTDGGAAADAAYTQWKTGNTSLYYYDTQSLSYKVATGSSKRWYYKS